MEVNEIVKQLGETFAKQEDMKPILDKLDALEAQLKKEEVKDEDPKMIEVKFWQDIISGKATGDLDNAANGDALIPEVVYNKIHIALQHADWVRANATVQVSNYKEDIPILNTGATAYWVADGTAPTASVLNATTISFKSNRAAAMVTTSNLLMSAATPSILDTIYTAIGNAFAVLDRSAVISGTGSGQWAGLQSATITTVTAATGHTAYGDIDYDDIMDLFMAVPEQYRYLPETKFIVHGNLLGTIRKLKDSNGQPIFNPKDNTIFGKQVIEEPNMPTTGTTNPIAYFGYLKDYWVIDRQGMKISTTNQGYELVSKQQTLVYVDVLTDAHLIDATGWAGLLLSAT